MLFNIWPRLWCTRLTIVSDASFTKKRVYGVNKFNPNHLLGFSNIEGVDQNPPCSFSFLRITISLFAGKLAGKGWRSPPCSFSLNQITPNSVPSMPKSKRSYSLTIHQVVAPALTVETERNEIEEGLGDENSSSKFMWKDH